MLLTVEQVRQLVTLLQEYPETTHISIYDQINGSGIGPDTFAKYIKWSKFKKPNELGVVDITDTGTW
jgi:hypothetical protein